MLTIYPACFYKEDSGYSVIFPDLNWLSTCGDTLEQAIEMAIDCLAGYIHFSKELGHDFPPPSEYADINPVSFAKELDPNSPVGECFVNMVSVDVDAYAKMHFEKPVKKTLTIPMWLNNAALAQNINFSQVLQEALLLKLKVQ